jgi:hypothetical protein
MNHKQRVISSAPSGPPGCAASLLRPAAEFLQAPAALLPGGGVKDADGRQFIHFGGEQGSAVIVFTGISRISTDGPRAADSTPGPEVWLSAAATTPRRSHRERLEAALVKGTGPLRVMLRVPALRVRESQPTHEFGEIAVALRPNHQMPMVRHDAIGQQADVHPVERFGQQADKGLMISGFGKERGPSEGAIEQVVEITTFSMAH